MKKHDSNWATYAVIVEVRARRIAFSDRKLRYAIENAGDVVQWEAVILAGGPHLVGSIRVRHIKNWHRIEP